MGTRQRPIRTNIVPYFDTITKKRKAFNLLSKMYGKLTNLKEQSNYVYLNKCMCKRSWFCHAFFRMNMIFFHEINAMYTHLITEQIQLFIVGKD